MKLFESTRRSGAYRIVAMVLAVIFTMSSMSFSMPNAYALGRSGAGAGTLAGQLGLSIGFSGEIIKVHTAAELYDISLRVNSGESFANKMIAIEDEIQLRELQQWTPLGTSSHPFNGYFTGQDNIVRGLESEHAVFSTLFGQVVGGDIRDLTLAVRSPDDLQEVYSYLYVGAQASTFVNCRVVLDIYSPFRLLRNNLPSADIAWYNTTATDFTISTIEQLMGLAKLVNEGTDDFGEITLSGAPRKTIKLDTNLDMNDFAPGPWWKPIGTEEKPFRGEFTSAGASVTIGNLAMQDPTVASAGLFGHIADAKISNIHLVDASIAAGDNAGILVGHMTDSEVVNCYTTGKISGVTGVGGVIGYATDSDKTLRVTAVDSYSTADVVGTNRVGGFIGIMDEQSTINTCFATGNVNGILTVGGFLGQAFSDDSYLIDVAATGNVNGSGGVGGIVGAGVDFGGNILLEQAYSASRVDGYSDGGLIVGTMAITDSCYGSGQIFGVNQQYINAGGGYGARINGGAFNPDARYGAAAGGMQADMYNTSLKIFFDINHTTGYLTGFTPCNLVYAAGANNESLPIGGNYPELTAFTGHSSSAFSAFSEVSTDAKIVRIPSELTYKDGKLCPTGITQEFELPTVNGDVQWHFGNGRDTLIIADNTVQGDNSVTIGPDNKLTMKYPPVENYSIVVQGTVRNVDGMVIKKTITISDKTARPILAKLSPSLRYEKNEVYTEQERLSNLENRLFIEFSEPLRLTTPLINQPQLIVCDDQWNETSTTIPVTITVVSNTILKVEWAPNLLGYGTKLKLDIPESLNIEDENGCKVNIAFYAMSETNWVAELAFNPYTPNQVELNADKTIQKIQMVINDPAYNPVNGYMEGIDIENVTAITLADTDITFKTIHTLFGTADFPAAAGETAADRHNFYQYPGVYEFKYQVDDPQEPTKKSNEITRTYEVTSGIKDLFLEGGQFGETYLPQFQPYVLLDGKALGQVLTSSTPATAHENILKALEQKLQSTHKATIVLGTGQEKTLKIDYDFSQISTTVYKDGYNGVVLYSIDGEASTYPLNVQIESALNLMQITTRQDRYVIPGEKYEEDRAMQFFDPRLERNSKQYGAEQIAAAWSLEGTVSESNALSHQPVTIVASNIYGMPDLTMTKVVFVSFKEDTLTPFDLPEVRKPQMDGYFWERVEMNIRAAKPGATVEAHVGYNRAIAPASVFKALAQQDNVTLRMDFVNDMSLSINSKNVDTAALKSPAAEHNVYVEKIENMDINRDANNRPTQQFYADGYYDIPGGYTLRMPLDPKLADTEEMSLYSFDAKTREYTLITKINDSDVTDGYVSLEMKTISGEYVLCEYMGQSKKSAK